MFYKNYELLCQKVGKKPYTVAREIGLGNSNVAQWKKGSTPRPEILQKIADYFDVSQAVLLGFESDQKEKSPTPEGVGLSLENLSRLLGNMSDEDLSALIADAALEMAKRNARK